MKFLMKLLKPKPEVIDEGAFRYCLAKVKTKARIIRTNGKVTIEIRPENVDELKEALDAHGALNEATGKAIQFLNTNPGEFVRFAHQWQT